MGSVIRGAFGSPDGDVIPFDRGDFETGDPNVDFSPISAGSKQSRDRLFAQSRFRVHTVIQAVKKKNSLVGQATAVLNAILSVERQVGSIFVKSLPECEPYLFEGSVKRFIRIHEKSEDCLSYMWARYGLNSKDAFTQMVITNLKNFILTKGWVRQGRRYAAYSTRQQVLRVSRYDGQIWEMDGTNIVTDINGRDVFFIDDDGGRAWPDSFLPDIPDHVDPHDSLLLKTLTGFNFVAESPSGMRPDDQRRALTAWIFCSAFPDLMPTKPMLLVEGVMGSGKTVAIKIIQYVIHGRARTLILDKDKPDDFPVQLLRSTPIAMFDNVDSYVEWLPDKLAAYITDGQFTKRKLYTDNNEATIRPQSMPAVTTANPVSFRRQDIPDRSIIIRLDRREGDFTNEGEVFRALSHQVPKLYGEWLYWLNRIVLRLRELGGAPRVQSALRMADFAGLMEVVGSVLGWTDAEMQSTVDGILREQMVFAGETDPLPDLLDRWLADTKNVGRSIEAQDLLTQLNAIAQALDKTKIRSVNGLIQKIRSPHVHAVFDVRSVHRGNVWTYIVRRRDE